MDSDSDQDDFEQYSELDAFDTDEVEVSPEDEQALAAFMVGCTNQLPDHYILSDDHIAQLLVSVHCKVRCTPYKP